MVRHYFQYIIALTGIFLFTITTSVFAVESQEISEVAATPNGAFEYQLQLLSQFIDTYNPSLSIDQKNLMCKTILAESQSTGFDPFFISSIIAAESSFYPRAVSPCKALGLMQLTSCVYQAMNLRDPFNIQENIHGGTRFLQYLKNQFRDSNLILAAYNAGPTRVARLGRIPRIRETIAYVKKVNSLYLDLRENFLVLLKNSLNKIQLCQTLKEITASTHGIQFAVIRNSSFPTDFGTPGIEICESKRVLGIFFQA